MRFSFSLAPVCAVLLILSLAACGGGGGGGATSGGGGTTPPPAKVLPGAGPAVPPGSASGATPGVYLVAGNIGGAGSIDGNGASARFSGPVNVAVDSSGTAWVYDGRLRRVTPDGKVTTFATDVGVRAMTTDDSGNLYVAAERTVLKFAADGSRTVLAGADDASVSLIDGNAKDARFGGLAGIARDKNGNLYVSDTPIVPCIGGSACGGPPTLRYTAIRKISAAGTVSTLAGSGQSATVFGGADGQGKDAAFTYASSLTIDGAGNLFVADVALVRKVTPDGNVTTVVGKIVPGVWIWPKSALLAMDAAGNFYGAAGNTITRTTPDGTTAVFAGTTERMDPDNPRDGPRLTARIGQYGPGGMAFAPDGSLFFTDPANNTLRKIDTAGMVSTVAGRTQIIGNDDGSGVNATFNEIVDLAADKAGNLVAFQGNGALRKITPEGIVSTAAVVGASTLRTGALGADGAFYTTSFDSTLRKYSATGQQLYAKTMVGCCGGLVVDTLSNAFSFVGNYEDTKFYRFDAQGEGAVVTIPGLQNSMTGPMALDANGNLYFAGKSLRRVAPDGVITVVAGNDAEAGSIDGSGSAARFNSPGKIALDADRNAYIIDASGTLIRKVTPGGVVTTVAGVANQTTSFLAGVRDPLPYMNGIVVAGPNTLLVSTRWAVLKIVLP